MREFTSAVPEPEDNPLAGFSFSLDGTEFKAQGRLPALAMAELARVSTEAVADDDAEGQARQAAVLAKVMRQALGPETYAAFMAHTEAHDTADEVVMTILQHVMESARDALEQMTGRPTSPRQPSSPGPQDPGERMSRIISLQRGDVQVIGEEDPKTGRQVQRAQPARPSRARRKAG